MDRDEYDELVRRLTALVVKLDERLDVQEEFNRQQVEFNKQQRETNARLETLMQRVFHERINGQEA